MIKLPYVKAKFNTYDQHIFDVMCILDVAKVLMYQFYYYYIKNKYGSNPKLLLTDTDYLRYKIKKEDAYEDFSKDKEMFDFSNYCAESKYHDWLKQISCW